MRWRRVSVLGPTIKELKRQRCASQNESDRRLRQVEADETGRIALGLSACRRDPGPDLVAIAANGTLQVTPK